MTAPSYAAYSRPSGNPDSQLPTQKLVALGPRFRGDERKTLTPKPTLNPKLAAALAALVDAEKKLLQCRPLADQTLLV